MLEIRAQTIRSDGSIKPSLVMIENGRVQSVATIPRNACQTNMLLCPGLLDLQVNGAGGVLFNEAPDINTLRTIGETLAQYGTSGWLATLVTDDLDVMSRAVDAVAEAINETAIGVKGIHFEGPHISEQKRGVHKAEFIRPLADAEMQLYSRTDLGAKLLTIAPEVVSAEQIQQLVNSGCVVSIGHTNADYDLCKAAITAGASCFTHLYNAMTGMQGRAPGAIGAALATDVSYGLIMDGFHVHPTMARMAYQQNQNMLLITDAMPVIGTQMTSFNWYGQPVTLQEGRLLDQNGRLAGAALTQNQALANAMLQLELSIEDVVPMATSMPARLIGLMPELGSIEAGASADLVLLDETADVGQVWRSGKEVYRA